MIERNENGGIDKNNFEKRILIEWNIKILLTTRESRMTVIL